MKVKGNHVKVSELPLVTYIKIGTATIALPADTPFGISRCNPNDRYNPVEGEAWALHRLFEELNLREELAEFPF